MECARQDRWRQVVGAARQLGLPCPAFNASLDYYDSLRTARLPANQEYLLTGRSWSGSGPIVRTEISTDGARRWYPAIPRDPGTPAAWQRWEFRWRTPGPGSYTLRARATDATGATQPATVTRNTFGYHFGGIAEHPVSTA